MAWRCEAERGNGRSCGLPALGAGVAVLVMLSTSAAQAACSSTTPADGSTVTCTGADVTGVGDGTQSNVTVNVQSGASISVGNGARAINLGDIGNAVTNNGTINVGNFSAAGIRVGDGNAVVNNAAINGGFFAYGINTFDNNNIVNNGTITLGAGSYGLFIGSFNTTSNSGRIAVGDNGYGINAADSNVITNRGAIIVGNSTVINATGINVRDDNTAYNYGTISTGNGNGLLAGHGIAAQNGGKVFNFGSISTGDFGEGIRVDGTATAVTNAAGGTITSTNYGAGISINGTANTLANYGTINAVTAYGILVYGTGNAVTNFGTVAVSNGPAILINDSGNTVTNYGTVTATAFGEGVTIFGDSNIVENAGKITVSDGIGIAVDGNTNTVTNRGTITATAGGIGVQLGGSDNTLNNYGTIRALGAGSMSVDACPCTTNNVVNNYGTLDGTVMMTDTFAKSHTLNNSGLITITDSISNTPLAVHGVDGAFNQSATGIVELRVTNVTDGSDVLFADSATIAGTLRVAPQPGLYGNTTTYTNVFTTANAVATPFDRYRSTSPFFGVSPTYDSGDPASYTAISLTLSRIPFGGVPGMTDNQRAVGNALEANYSTNVTGNAATLYSNLFTATSVGVLDQLSGQGTAATQGAAFFGGGQFMWLLNQAPFGASIAPPAAPLGFASADKSHPAAGFARAKHEDGFAQRWQAWAGGFGGVRSIAGNGGGGGTVGNNTRAGGAAAGVIYRSDADTLVGAAVGVSQSHFKVDDLATSGDLTAGHAGLHAAKRWGAFYVTAAMTYAHIKNDTKRTIAGVGPIETATGHFASDLLAGRMEWGWRHDLGRFTVTPFAAIQYAQLWQRGYSEASTTSGGGPGILGLTYASQSITSFPVTLGAQFDTRYVLPNGQVLTPYTRVAWVHEFNPDSRIDASFISVPGTAFTVAGARIARDAAQINAGAKLSLNATTAVVASINADVAAASSSAAATGALLVSW